MEDSDRENNIPEDSNNKAPKKTTVNIVTDCETTNNAMKAKKVVPAPDRFAVKKTEKNGYNRKCILSIFSCS